MENIDLWKLMFVYGAFPSKMVRFQDFCYQHLPQKDNLYEQEDSLNISGFHTFTSQPGYTPVIVKDEIIRCQRAYVRGFMTASQAEQLYQNMIGFS